MCPSHREQARPHSGRLALRRDHAKADVDVFGDNPIRPLALAELEIVTVERELADKYADATLRLQLDLNLNLAGNGFEREVADEQITVAAEGLDAGRFEGAQRVVFRVEPGRFLQFGVGVAAAGVDARNLDIEGGVGGCGVLRIEIESAFKLAERAVDP